MLSASGEKILLSLWVGGLWSVGFVVVPTIFATLDNKATAGALAGTIFTHSGWVAVFCASLLLFLASVRLGLKVFLGRISGIALIVAIGLTLVNLLWTQPQIITAIAENLPKADFKWLHQVASAIYLAVAVLSLLVLLFYPLQQNNAAEAD